MPSESVEASVAAAGDGVSGAGSGFGSTLGAGFGSSGTFEGSAVVSKVRGPS